MSQSAERPVKIPKLAIALFALLPFGVGAAMLLTNLAGQDFIVFYAAAKLVATGHGREILDPMAILAAEHAAEPARDLLLPWVHPPAVALLLSPLALLPFAIAAATMVALDVACLVWAVHALRTVAAPTQRRWLFPLAVIAPPALFSLIQGQTTPLVLALVVAALGASPFRSGLALGLTAIRPQTALLFALAGMSSRRSALGVIVGWATITAASAAVVGADGLILYVGQLLGAGTWSVTGAYGMRLSIGWVGLALAAGLPALGLALAVGSLVLGAVLVLRARGVDRILEAAAWCAIASPHVELGDGLATYPAIAERAGRSTAAMVLLVGSGYLVALATLAGLPLAPPWMLTVALSRHVRRRVRRPTLG